MSQRPSLKVRKRLSHSLAVAHGGLPWRVGLAGTGGKERTQISRPFCFHSTSDVMQF